MTTTNAQHLLMHNSDWSDRRIARAAGCSHSTVARLRRQLTAAGVIPPAAARPLFASDNDYGVPVLDARLQPAAVTPPVLTWGSVQRGAVGAVTWHYFTDDSRFNALWDKPDLLVALRPYAAVEPDWSILPDMPMAAALYEVYRKRWTARYWQAAGIPVYAALNVAVEWRRLNRLGLPSGWRSFATRGYSERVGELLDEFRIAQDISGDQRPLFLVVGGGRAAQEMAQAHGWIWVNGGVL